jgi:PAS domain S-box-containing protein
VSEALHKFDVAEALHESERRFRALFERHHETMLLAEPGSGAVVDANPAAAAFFGQACRRLCSATLTELGLPVPAARTGRVGSRGGAVIHRRELTVRAAHGKPREVEIRVSPMTVQKRRLLFLVVRDTSERRQLERRLLELGESEWQQLGRDLHDSLGGELTGISLLTKALAQGLAAKSAPEAAVAEEIVAHLNQAISQTRSLAHGLCPVELSGQHWVDCLQDLAVNVERLPGVTCRLEFAVPSPSLDNTVATHLFRIVQEAVHNALRHGQAKKIVIRFSQRRCGVRLEIRSDGIDFPAWPDSPRGLGLRTIRYRAEAIGAGLEIRRNETGGTVVSCDLPPHPASRACPREARDRD